MRSTSRRAIGLAAGLALLAPSSHAQSRKLSGPFQTATGGDVTEAAISPDGVFAVYLADQDTDGVLELYRVPAKGGEVVKVNQELVEGGDVRDFRISPDSSRVVYRASQDLGDPVGLFSASLGAEPRPVRLNGPIESAAEVASDFSISPDSRRVVFRVEPYGGNRAELYSVPLGGGPATELVPSAGVTAFEISADSSRVVYRADRDPSGVFELFTVPIDGGSPVELDPFLATPADVLEFRISPDSRRVVFRSDRKADEVFELFSVPIAGGVVASLNAPLVPGGDVLSFETSPDSRRVVYRADQDRDGVLELFSVAIDGGAAVKLNGPFAGSGSVRLDYRISPDSSRVLYRADQDRPFAIELFSVPIGGGPPVKLSGPLVQGGGVEGDFQVSPDSQRVVYRADQDVDGVIELFSVAVQGGAAVKLDPALAPNGDVAPGFRISPDSRRVVLRADAEADEAFELYSIPVGGGTPTKLNAPLVPGGDVQVDLHVGADSIVVLYRADQIADDVFELHGASIDGTRPPVVLSGPLATSLLHGDVQRFEISPDGSRGVYLADREIGGVLELYSVPLLAAPRATKLNPAIVPGGTVFSQFHVSPDSQRVVYVASQDDAIVRELYSVPLEGGTAVKLNGPLTTFGSVFLAAGDPFLISPDSSRVVYRADQDTDEVFELYSVPIDGGAASRLNPSLVPEGDVYSQYRERGFQLSPDSRRVVYLADQDTDEVLELYSVPIDGGTAIELNGPLVAGGDVSPSFQISPDSSRVVYLADEETDGVTELFSVPIDGGPTTKLNGTLVGDVFSSYRFPPFEISPDSRRVLYLANQEDLQSEELYSAPIDGGPVMKLSEPLVQYGDVLGFQISGDSSRVVYWGHAETARLELRSVAIDGGGVASLSVPGLQVWSFLLDPGSGLVVYSAGSAYEAELYSVPVTGGASARLKAPLVPPAYAPLDPFKISPDSTHVVYLSWRGTSFVNELYAVPIGGGDSFRLNGPLAPRGDVAPYASLLRESFQGSSDSSQVLYLADQDRDEMVELYASALERHHPRHVGSAESARP